jgi:apolipoprotein D and lipocalin family protein
MKTIRTIGTLLLLLLLAGCAAQPSRADLNLIEVDLQRFMGNWYVIANIPYWLENGKVATRDEYQLMDDGRVKNDFVFKRGFDRPEKRWEGVSTVLPTQLQVLEVSTDYRWAILASPDRQYAWIFHREPSMDDALYLDLLSRLQGRGVDPCAIAPVAQKPADLQIARPKPPSCSG